MTKECGETLQELGEFDFNKYDLDESFNNKFLGAFRYTNGDVYIGEWHNS